VRQLPALATLDVHASFGPDHPVEWPPFIPPTLKALSIDVSGFGAATESLLRALPGMLGASGARLERLEIEIPDTFEELGDGLVHVAQVLRCCSATLKDFRLRTRKLCARIEGEPEDYTDRVERLRVEWAELLAGVSACRELEALVLTQVEVDPLFPPGTTFGRLTHLKISDSMRERPPDDAGGVGLWELMESGGLPALAKLRVRRVGRGGGVEEVRTRVAPALEAVAGTLTELCLHTTIAINPPSDGERGLGYELGVAVGKLRRLHTVALALSGDGRVYHAFAQGLAASGGDRPLPLLWRVILPPQIDTNADLVASLLLPSVRVFGTPRLWNRRAFLLTACAVRQAGYKHSWVAPRSQRESESVVGEIARCRFSDLYPLSLLLAINAYNRAL
jgi:hypothetical protein